MKQAMLRTSLLIILILNTVGCACNDLCPPDQLEEYLEFYDTNASDFLGYVYLIQDHEDRIPEISIVMMSTWSDFRHLSKPPKCAEDHKTFVSNAMGYTIDLILDIPQDSKSLEEKLSEQRRLWEKAFDETHRLADMLEE